MTSAPPPPASGGLSAQTPRDSSSAGKGDASRLSSSSSLQNPSLGNPNSVVPPSRPSTSGVAGDGSDSSKQLVLLKNPSARSTPNLGFSESHSENPSSKSNTMDTSVQEPPLIPADKPTSYAAAATPRQQKPPAAFVHDYTAIHPVKQGQTTIIQMPDSIYSERLQAFQFALIGRLFQPKGSVPRPLPDLKSELSSLFRSEEDWRLTPLGKGFFSLKFSSHTDQLQASRASAWRLKSGTFHIRDWKPDFDPYKEQTSVAQVWVRLFHLPEEYWDPEFLVGIFRAVGNIVKLDGSTAMGLVGHFARALVEVDLNLPLLTFTTVTRSSVSFQVDFSYENLPLFCTFCKYVGHSVETCNHAKRKAMAEESSNKNPKNQPPHKKAPTVNSDANAEVHANKGSKKVWVEVEKDTPVQTSNAFQALEHAAEQEDAEASGPSGPQPVRQMVPLSPEMEAAVASLKHKDFSAPPEDREDFHASGSELEADSDREEEKGSETQQVVTAIVAVSNIPDTDAVAVESGRETQLELTSSSLLAMARRIEKLSGREILEDNLRQASGTGISPTAYAIEPGNTSSIRDMEDVSRKNWTDVIDSVTSEKRTAPPRSQ